MKKQLFVLAFISVVVSSCFKQPCESGGYYWPSIEGYFDEAIIPVYQGQVRTFYPESSYLRRDLSWGTPSGDIVKSDSLTIGPMTSDMAGEYRLVSNEDGCVRGVGFTLVYEEIDPPCNPTINTVERTIVDGANTSYAVNRVRVDEYRNQHRYRIELSRWDEIVLSFKEKPTRGVYDADGYKIENQDLSMTLSYISQITGTSTTEYNQSDEIPFYIEKVDGQLVAIFCSIPLVSNWTAERSTITGKIVLE